VTRRQSATVLAVVVNLACALASSRLSVTTRRTPVSEPTTAERSLLERMGRAYSWHPVDGRRDEMRRAILDIRAEARADALAEVAAAVEGLTDPVDAERFRAAVLALLEKAS
jgi:hypothetical protein